MRSGPASATKTDCCGCFQRKKRDSLVLSDIYCTRNCSGTGYCAQRAPLGPPENQCSCTSADKITNLLNQSDYEFGKEKYKTKPKKKIKEKHNNAEFEFADDAISLNNEYVDERPPSRTSSIQSHTETSFTENPYINVNGKEELPCVQEISKYNCISNQVVLNKIVKTEPKIIITNNDNNHKNKINTNFDGNYNKLSVSKIYSYCTLPKRKYSTNHKLRPISPPKRITPDGTHIYYWCDLPKKIHAGKV